MSDMVFLVRNDCVIEDMNRSAIRAFGDYRARLCYEALHGGDGLCLTCPVKLIAAGEENEGLAEAKLGGLNVECSYVPFQGYKGDRLVMVVMRNLREVGILPGEPDRRCESDELVGKSKKTRDLRKMIHLVAPSDMTVLISGESGTGKELVADLIHRHSRRADKPLLKFNGAVVAESLGVSDLFGFEEGTFFTGTATPRKGGLELVHGATVFLDEIGDVGPKMQAGLLRVLKNGEITRGSGPGPAAANVRIIAATSKDLAREVEEGRFRQDLYQRLNVINLHLPPLRERKEDILSLVTHFIEKYRKAFGKEVDHIPDSAVDRLLQHSWPGNIRELEDVIQRAVLLTRNNIITEKELIFN
ncbi:MAG TPA: sigma-54-dependent Fis family transcriptional regulator [Desulfobacteraceae bacterium]|nr:sigma-54-dependent Fis family transcriptional regulator [Desulfobacteraceae bacterium]